MVQENVGSGMSECYVARLGKANYAIEETLCKKKRNVTISFVYVAWTKNVPRNAEWEFQGTI